MVALLTPGFVMFEGGGLTMFLYLQKPLIVDQKMEFTVRTPHRRAEGRRRFGLDARLCDPECEA